jgi:hypothetical protein
VTAVVTTAYLVVITSSRILRRILVRFLIVSTKSSSKNVDSTMQTVLSINNIIINVTLSLSHSDLYARVRSVSHGTKQLVVNRLKNIPRISFVTW